MMCYQVDAYWETSSYCYHRVIRGSFEECLDYAVQSFIGSNAHWSIVLGELIDSSLFLPIRLVARSAYVSCIS